MAVHIALVADMENNSRAGIGMAVVAGIATTIATAALMIVMGITATITAMIVTLTVITTVAVVPQLVATTTVIPLGTVANFFHVFAQREK